MIKYQTCKFILNILKLGHAYNYISDGNCETI